jgi:hypothetical protein
LVQVGVDRHGGGRVVLRAAAEQREEIAAFRHQGASRHSGPRGGEYLGHGVRELLSTLAGRRSSRYRERDIA